MTFVTLINCGSIWQTIVMAIFASLTVMLVEELWRCSQLATGILCVMTMHGMRQQLAVSVLTWGIQVELHSRQALCSPTQWSMLMSRALQQMNVCQIALLSVAVVNAHPTLCWRWLARLLVSWSAVLTQLCISPAKDHMPICSHGKVYWNHFWNKFHLLHRMPASNLSCTCSWCVNYI